MQVARALDHPRRVFGTRVTVPVKDQHGQPAGRRDADVWHCSLSLRAEEGVVSDERWAEVAQEFVAGMGFDGDGPGCRWAALRHGVSKAGNDHVHVVVSLVREDGSKARVNRDRPHEALCGELERRHGLMVLESRDGGYGNRGYKPIDQDRGGEGAAIRPEQTARGQLERAVRVCAAAAGDEVEFVRRLRGQGLRVRPRFAAGRGDLVEGYSVALAPSAGKAPEWFGGGRLARDLTLPRLRSGWSSAGGTAGEEAVREWAGAASGQPAGAGVDAAGADPAMWARYSEQIVRLSEQLRTAPVTDRAQWAQIAGEGAAVFAAWSLRVEPDPGPLAAAALALGRSAQLPAWRARPRPTSMPSTRGTVLLLAAAAGPAGGALGWVVLLRQLANLAKALHDVHQAAGELQRAREIEQMVRSQLAPGRWRPEGGPSGPATGG